MKLGIKSLYNVMGIILRWKNFNSLLEIDILRNYYTKLLVVLRGDFLGFGCLKEPDIMLAKTLWYDTVLIETIPVPVPLPLNGIHP